MHETLRSGRDIATVLRTGAAARGPSLRVHVRCGPPTAQPPAARVAVVAGRRVGGAVQRNRAKRRLRAAWAATAADPGPGSLDVVLVAGPAALAQRWPVLRDECAQLVRRATQRARRRS